MLKCQFHIHADGDPLDGIPYSPQDLIKEAARLGYDAIAITCHRRRLFSKSLKKYAQKKGILLIPGMEMEINKKEILALNIDEDIYKVRDFNELRAYKASHPEAFFVAPHPFFFTGSCLREKVIEHIDIFDAIEHSFYYTKFINFNQRAKLIAKKFDKPMLATSDCHILKYLDLGFSYIDAEKNARSIFSAIRQGKIEMVSSPIGHLQAVKIISIISFQTLKKFLKDKFFGKKREENLAYRLEYEA